tara:strand:- start:6418 stop:6945 length:528 start_codon:yes stop_codon:yes gene_type:complete
MANQGHGYIGRQPGESSVIVARQQYTPSVSTTDFTFGSGYTVGYIDAYLNGSRLIEGSDYNATDGSTLILTSAAQSGDVLELVAYKSFSVTDAVVGIQSAGSTISSSAANLNFVGTGNTFAVNTSTNTVDISISAGAATTMVIPTRSGTPVLIRFTSSDKTLTVAGRSGDVLINL